MVGVLASCISDCDCYNSCWEVAVWTPRLGLQIEFQILGQCTCQAIVSLVWVTDYSMTAYSINLQYMYIRDELMS